MKLIKRIAQFFTGAKKARLQKAFDKLTVDEQYAILQARVDAENAREDKCISEAYPAGFFIMTSRYRGEVLCHWNPALKMLTENIKPGEPVTLSGSSVVAPSGLQLKRLPTSRPIRFGPVRLF